MSDNHRRHSAIKAGLMQFFENRPTGRQAQYLNVLSAMISGLVGARNAHLSAIASKVPSSAKRESQIKQFSRLLANERVEQATFFAPFAKALLTSLSHTTLVLAVDASAVGQGCMALLLNVVYKGRALPLGWLVVKAKKGHLAEEYHLQLLRQVKPLIPTQAQVVLVADGEFDGTSFLRELQTYTWHYVCRTAKNSWLWLDDDQTSFAGLSLLPGTLVEIPQALFTQEEYGPVLALGWWQKGYDEPCYLVSNFELSREALWYYQKRFHIETFFSDQKSRGFQLERSHLDQPERIGRLLIVACLAYLWLVYLGTLAKVEGWDKVIHRTDRCDLSLFSLGLALLDHFMNHFIPLSVAFIPLSWEDC